LSLQELAQLQKEADRLAAEEVHVVLSKPNLQRALTSHYQVQQLGVMEELKQQMVQRQQQAEQLAVELRAARGEKFVIMNNTAVFR
jgi:hypothetical protein